MCGQHPCAQRLGRRHNSGLPEGGGYRGEYILPLKLPTVSEHTVGSACYGKTALEKCIKLKIFVHTFFGRVGKTRMAYTSNFSYQQQRKCLVEQLWLHYFNSTLHENGLITETQRNRIANMISSRNTKFNPEKKRTDQFQRGK